MADVSVTFGATDEGLEKTLKALQSETDQLKLKMRTTEMSVTEAGAAMKKIAQNNDLEKKLRQVGDESQGASSKVKTLGTTAEDAGEKGKIGFGKIAIGAGIAGAAAKAGSMAIDAAFAAAQKTVASFGDALNMGGRLADLSERTGVAVDKVMLLERAFQNTGVGADSLGPILNKMQKAIVDAGDGSSKAADAFTKLGIPLSTLQDLSPDEQLREIGKAIARIPDPAERAAVSMEIFGKSGGALNQVFANMDGEIETAKAQLGSLPDIMKAGAAQFDKISDNLTIIGGKIVEFAAGIIDKIKPALDALTTALTRIDAAKLGQDFAEFFTGAGEGMKGFQAAIDAIDAGDMGTAFKIIAQAIQLQFKETANEIYRVLIAAFQSAGQFLGAIFDPSGALISTAISAFEMLGKRVASGIQRDLATVFQALPYGLGESVALTLNDMANQSNTAANKIEDDLKGAGGRIFNQFAEAGKAFPDSIKENYAKVPPLFTDLEKHQQEIDRLTQGITKSQGEQTASVDGTTKAQAAAEQEARKYFGEYQKGQAKALEDAEKAKKVEAEKQAKLEEVLGLKREEYNAQIGINKAIEAGNLQEAEALKNAESLRKTIDDLIKTGFGEPEATKMANEMARAAREAERVQKSLATKIGEDIKSKQEADAIDPGGKLMKKAQEQIAAGQFASARATGEQLRIREKNAMIRGTGEERDTRSIKDIGRDYGLSGSEKEIRDQLYKIRTEGQSVSDKAERGLKSTQNRMGVGMKKEAENKSEKKGGPITLDGMVKSILELIEKIEPKLPTAALIA